MRKNYLKSVFDEVRYRIGNYSLPVQVGIYAGTAVIGYALAQSMLTIGIAVASCYLGVKAFSAAKNYHQNTRVTLGLLSGVGALAGFHSVGFDAIRSTIEHTATDIITHGIPITLGVLVAALAYKDYKAFKDSVRERQNQNTKGSDRPNLSPPN